VCIRTNQLRESYDADGTHGQKILQPLVLQDEEAEGSRELPNRCDLRTALETMHALSTACTSGSAVRTVKIPRVHQWSRRAEESAASSKAPFDFWGVANAVADTVKRGAGDIASTVRETDWRAEIAAFGKDVVEETEELGHHAVAAVEHAVDTVEHLPQHVRALSRYDSVLPRNSEDPRNGDPQTEAAIGLKRRRRDVSLCWRKWHLHL